MSVIEGHRVSPQQARLSLLSQVANPPMAKLTIDIKGDLETEVLRSRIEAVLSQHESLRTRLAKIPGKKLPLQIVADAMEIQWQVLQAQDEQAAQQSSEHWSQTPIQVDLEKSCTIHAQLIHYGDRFLFNLKLPAIHVDFQSLNNLFLSISKAFVEALDDEEPTQYLDFSEWLQELAEDSDAEAGKSFWTRQNLAELPSVTWHGEKAANAAFSEASLSFQPEPHRYLELNPITLSAAWYAFLTRYLGHESLVLNHYYHGRIDSELNDGVGLFATNLPLHVDFNQDQSFSSLLARYSNHLLEAETNAIYQPLESTAHHLPGIHFEYFQYAQAPQRGSVECTLLNQEISHSPHKLKLSVAQRDAQLEFKLFYNATAISETAAKRLLDSFGSFLCHLNPEEPLARIHMVGSQQSHQLLVDFNQVGAAYSKHLTLDQWFTETANTTPDAPAIESGNTSWSFSELETRSNQLAHLLKARGVGTESVVPVCLQRDATLIAAILAVLKTGAAYIGIDAQYPRERVAHMVGKTQMALVTEETKSLFPSDGPDLLILDNHLSQIDTQPSTPLTRSIDARHPAYIIYTSGSTGTPKGVVISHESAVNYVHWCMAQYLDPQLQGSPVHSSIGFDLTVTSIFPALLSGKKVHMVADDAGVDGLKDLLSQEPNFGLVKLTPSHLRLLQMDDALGKVTEGTAFVIGGEALLAEDLTGFWQTHSKVRVFNEYGPTEATVGCCVHPVAAGQTGAISIGKPIQGMQCYALDRGLNPVGYYQPGELYIAGIGLARGYRNQPGLTAARFIPNPFSQEPGSRMYQTGDLVHFLGDAKPQLYFLGRNDGQVKIRGFRVELKDIEVTLKKLDSVTEAVVIPDKEDPSTRLLAYYVASEALKINQIRAFLEDHLPHYMIPAQFINLQRIPLTVNGKVDVEALPKPDSFRPDLTTAYVAPRNELESSLSQIWQDVLSLEQVGIHDNFFALGGDSIRSVRVAAEASHRGIGLTVQNLFEAPTIARLTEVIQNQAPSGATEASQPGDDYVATEPFSLIKASDRAKLPASVEDAYPLSAVQMGMLFHMQITKDSASPPDYHNLNSFEIQVPFEPQLFRQAVEAVHKRHAILRTSFDLTNFSEPLQLVHRDVPLNVECQDLRDLDSATQKQRISEFIRRENFSLVDITQAPLVGLTIQQTADDRIWLHYKEPHSIADGWSTNFNLVEIFENYLALQKGEPLPVREPLPVTYRDFIHMEIRTRKSPESQAFWEELMTEISPLELPPWQPDEGEATLADHKHYSQIPQATMARLSRVSETLGVPFKSILLAAHVKVMALFTGLNQITTGLVFNGRPEVPGGDQVRGLFLNTLPVPIPVQPGSWADLIRTVFHSETQILPHRRFPVSDLQSGSGRKPLVNVAFSMHHFHSATDILNSGQLAVTDSEDWSKTNYDLAVFFHRSEKDAKHMHLVVEGNIDRLSKSQLMRIVGYFQEVLAEIAAYGDTPGALHHRKSFLPEPEYQDLIKNWNQTEKLWQAPTSLHESVAHCTDKHPQSLAVIFEDQRLTYRELEQQANQMAHYLAAQGVGVESRVGLALYRSPNMIMCMLAILKCGAAYVPLDPDYPIERLHYMIEDSGISWLLTASDVNHDFGSCPNTQIIVLDDSATQTTIQSHQESRLQRPVHGQQAAYMIYTSGSTGNPKGTINSHQAIMNRIVWMSDYLKISPADRILQKTPFSFDVSVWEFFLPLMNGATLVFARPGGHKDNQYLAETIRKEGITTLHFVPSMLRHFLAEPSLGNLSTLKQVVCSGEALPSKVVADFHNKLDSDLHNLYGPTEAAVDVTAYACSKTQTEARIPIGKPISNTQIYVLDDHTNPLAVGAAGELHIGGINLARGYHGKPALTAQSFIPDPFASKPGMRLYKTGDQACFRGDGHLLFLGRRDFQVKFRGFRIELAEIENTLTKHQAVETSIVMIRKDQNQVDRLVGYFLPIDRTLSPTANLVEELRNDLRKKLPDYMVPTAFVQLEALPVTRNGKLNRKALPAPKEMGVHVSTNYRAPDTPQAQIMATIWQEVLGHERIGLDDNFFDLGGDSILSILIVAKAGTKNLQITSTQIFETQTIANLMPVALQKASVKIDQAPVTGTVPLTPIQTWFFEKQFANPNHWNQSIFLLSKTPLQSDLLAQTAHKLMQHHDSLRTHFQFTENGMSQRVAPPTPHAVFHKVCMQEGVNADLTSALEQEVSRWQASFDLQQGPLFKMIHFDLGAKGDHRLLILAHHLVVDGISWRILLEDLETIYRQLTSGEPPVLMEKTSSYKDWALHQEQLRSNPMLLSQIDYWCDPNRLQASPLPRDFPKTSAPNLHQHAQSARVYLDQTQTTKLLQEVPAAYGTRINDVLLCALGRVFQTWTGNASLWIDMETHGRQVAGEGIDISRTVGWFTAVYPMFLQMDNNTDIASQLISVKEQLRALPNDGVGYGQLRYLSQDPTLQQSLSQQSSPEVLFNYLGQFDQALKVDSQFRTAPESRGHQFGPGNERAHLLDIDCKVMGGQLMVSWTYCETVHSPSTIDQLAQQFISELEQIIQHCISEEAGSFTPSDFPEANLDLEELDDLVAKYGSFEE